MKMFEKKWVDLGLPSGTLWCDTNEEGYYSWNEMMNKFDEESLPKLTDFAELCVYCDWRWDDKKKGMLVIGSNTNSIFLPASGYRYNSRCNLYEIGYVGYYWSTSHNNYVYYLYFTHDNNISPSYSSNRAVNQSVRCIKRK